MRRFALALGTCVAWSVCPLMLGISTYAQQQQAPGSSSPATRDELVAAIERLSGLVEKQSRELEGQRAALREQQEKTAALERRMERMLAPGALGATVQPAVATTRSASPVPPAPAQEPQKSDDLKLLEGQLEAVAESQHQLAQRVGAVETSAAAAQRTAEGKFRQLGNFRLSGDLRFRYEPFVQAQQTTRQRVRFRARFNLQGNITDEIFGGISLTTGALDDPISTNQTLTGFFNRKTIGLDRYFIQYTPKWARNHAQFGVGKFAHPWIRTGLTFDADLNPEGMYSRLNWDFKNPAFKGITLVGMFFPFFERGGSTSTTTGVRADGYDAFIAGGQLQTRWKLGERVTLGLSVAGLNFVNADFIAQAHSPNPATAALANNLTGNSPNTNCLRTNVAGNVVGYCSRFLYVDTILTLGVNTGRTRWPLNFTFDFNNNARARRIVQNGTAVPTATLPNSERSAYWAEVQLGRLSEIKDIQFGYTFMRIERDALITAFNESDIRAGSNLAQHRWNFGYQFTNNVSLNYTFFLGRLVNAQDNIALVPGGKRAVVGGPCNVAPFTGCTDNFLKRQQFDVVYRF